MKSPEENEIQRILESRLCTQAQIDEACSIQEKMAAMGMRPRSVGEVLCERGFLEAEDLEAIQRDAPDEEEGVKVPGYEVLEVLGHGALGTVYKARQVSLDRTVALKVLDGGMAKDREQAERFLAEARIVARLNHTNLISGIDVGEANGLPFLVLEFADGVSLALLLRRGDAMDEERALTVGIQIARALEYAHRSGLVHGDVRPQNVIVTVDGVAKLSDLGIARRPLIAGEDEGGELRRTPYYVSPEQARGMTDLNPAADLYGLGVTLFHMVTGRLPFTADSLEGVLAKHLTEPPPSASDLSPEVSEATDAVILQCLQKAPQERPADATTLIRSLEAALAGVQGARGQAAAVTSSAAAPAPKSPAAGGSAPVSRKRRRRR